MQQSLFHRFCLRIALWAVMVFSLAGYHHHQSTHICLGWEHLMLHNHCHKGTTCHPTDANGQDTPCHCHSGKVLGLEKSVKKTVQQQDIRLVKDVCCAPFEYSFFFAENRKKHFLADNTPRGPCSGLFPDHGLRAPPSLVF